MPAFIDDTLRAVGQFSFQNTTTLEVQNLFKPYQFTLAHNNQSKRPMTTTAGGFMVPGREHLVAFDYQLTIETGTLTTEFLEFKLANTFESVSNRTTRIAYQTQCYANTIPAVTSGTRGFGIVEDAVASFSKTVDDVSVPLTQVAYGSFVAATPDTFAIGANREILFSDNLVAGREIVSGVIADVVSGVELSDNLVPTYAIYVEVIKTDNTVWHLEIPEAQISTNGSEFTVADTVTLPFLLLPVPGRRLYYLTNTGQLAQS